MKNKYGLILGIGILASFGPITYTAYKEKENNLTNIDKGLFGVGLLSLAATYSYGIDKNPNLNSIKKRNKLEKGVKK
ncbi:MAG TPA: hypothetical protein PK357_01045 [Candidatus Pacearchaeota archaeon]|nr:hypothetical protein [Candidatus Pacearchaeota archaeon]